MTTDNSIFPFVRESFHEQERQVFPLFVDALGFMFEWWAPIYLGCSNAKACQYFYCLWAKNAKYNEFVLITIFDREQTLEILLKITLFWSNKSLISQVRWTGQKFRILTTSPYLKSGSLSFAIYCMSTTQPLCSWKQKHTQSKRLTYSVTAPCLPETRSIRLELAHPSRHGHPIEVYACHLQALVNLTWIDSVVQRMPTMPWLLDQPETSLTWAIAMRAQFLGRWPQNNACYDWHQNLFAGSVISHWVSLAKPMAQPGHSNWLPVTGTVCQP